MLKLRLHILLAALLAVVAAGLATQFNAQQTCPCSLWTTSTSPGSMNADASAVELGVKFTADSSGTITGLRFYKYAQNGGTHTGHLWSSTGTLLGSVTFTNETNSGWQQANFAAPVSITAGTTYVASYHTDAGFYAFSPNGFATGIDNVPLHAPSSSASGGNGVFVYGASAFPTNSFNASNYWVDVVFTSGADTTPPTVVSTSPASNATGVATTGSIAATFSEVMNPLTISTSTMALRNASNVAIGATVTYDPTTLTATLTPAAQLVSNATYSATISGALGGVTDFAGNPLAANYTWSFTTGATPSCPCGIWSSTTAAGPMNSDPNAIELGMKFRADVNGTVSGLRFYKYALNTGTHTGHLWAADGTLLGSATFTNETSSGWQQATFSAPIAIVNNTTYVISYHTDAGNYAFSPNGFASSVDNAPLHAPSSSSSGGNGVFVYGASAFPSNTYNASNYWVDVLYTPAAADSTPPTVTTVTPAGGATGVATTVTPTVTFSEAMATASIGSSTVFLKNSGGTTIAASVAYNASTLTATLTPTAALANSTVYTVTVKGGASGVTDASGNALASDVTSSFTTIGDTTPPTVTVVSPVNGATGVATNVNVTATFSEAMTASTIGASTVLLKTGTTSIAATVSYNATTLTATLVPTAALANLTTYTVTVKGGTSGVADLAGNALASDFTWSFTTVADTTPPTVTAVSPTNGATGVATTTSVTATFSEAMTASTISASTILLKTGTTSIAATVTYSATTLTATLVPTAALANLTTYTVTVASGSAGVKDAAGNALAADVTWSFTTVADTTPPTVSGVTPAVGATAVAIATTVTATFSEAMAASTITATSFVLKDSNGTSIAASVSYAAATLTATLTPTSRLAYGTTYTATVIGGSGGVTDAAGNALAANYQWSFTTLAAPYSCPCSVWTTTTTPGPMDSQTGAVELGMKFTSDIDGYVTGLRFYKYSQNTGTHTGNLWSSTGTLLRSVTFTGETSSGWQQATFSSPVAVTANTTYVISYHLNTGFYAATTGGFTNAVDHAPLHALASVAAGGNGVYAPGSASAFPTQTFNASNYWVDAVFTLTPPDTTPPTVVSTSPASSAVGVSIASPVVATFSEPMTATTITTSTVTLSKSGVAVGATVTYDGTSQTATLTPTAPLAYLTTYTATIKSGSSGVKDANGNALATDYTWSFTTGVDTTGPSVVSTTPASGATGVVVNAPITVTFSEAVNPASVNTGITLRDASNTIVPSTVTYDATSLTATLRPSVWLAKASTYTATVAGGGSGILDSVGNPMITSVSWSFTTQGTGCPCSIWTLTTPAGPMAGDSGSGELGVKFRSDVAGFISGLRFYKYAANSGTHVGNLWSSTGTLLGSVTFSNETASGWQQMMFASPIAIAANTTYIASYHTNSGFYTASDQGLANAVDNPPLHALSNGSAGGNGVYSVGTTSAFPNQTFNSSNYWVDIVFTTSGTDTTPPWITGTTPAAGAFGVATNTAVTATFSEPIDATSVSASTFELRTSSNTVVAATITYNSATWTATLTPTAALTSGATYTATVKTGLRDVAGNALATPVSWTFATAPAATTPSQGPGGPILVVTSTANAFTQYYAEILRAEGFNEFNVVDIGSVTSTLLASYDLVIVGEQSLTLTQASRFVTWVQGGGNLIALRPDSKLASVLGLTAQGTTLSNAYLAIDTTQSPGAGITSGTMQFHGTADQYVTSTARTIATLYSDASHATVFPAVTLNTSGSGQAAAFTFDLARSVVYTRQGNPAWAGQERDGFAPIRSDDLYFGAKSGDVQPDWIDLNKVAIPQADEQQRLLANLILLMNGGKRPLPRFWYLPQGRKAVVLMTGDDHGSGGQPTRFASYVSQGPATCVVDNWDCIRASSYMYASTPVTNAQVAAWVAQGFDIGAHVTMDPTTQFGCGADFTAATLASAYTTQFANFTAAFPAAGAPKTHRMHCITWSDWSTQASTELSNGVRLDLTYYYWPPSWINDTPGVFTGSAMPMRYAASTGAPIDVYQATTQMTDESGQTYPKTINALLDNATGAAGFYGVYATNIHTDSTSSQTYANSIVSSAKTHGVGVVSAAQMLKWLDGRNTSNFSGLAWNGSTLTFRVNAGTGANGLQMMLPVQNGALHLAGLTLDAAPVSYTTQTIKGVAYAFVTAAPGQYVATYTP